jgi:hypothetical protein
MPAASSSAVTASEASHERRPMLGDGCSDGDDERPDTVQKRRPRMMLGCRCALLCLLATLCSACLLIIGGISALVGTGKYAFSQFGQDAFVRALLDGVHDGLFIEVGASDGITNSNSFLLEQWRGYRGICVEPGPRRWVLAWLRPRCFKSYSPVGNVDDLEVSFISGTKTAEHSHMQTVDQGEGGAVGRGAYTTRTVTLRRLVTQWQMARGWSANKSLDFAFVSIDTEGFEYEAIKGFPFERHTIKVLFVEANGHHRRLKRYLEALPQLMYVGDNGADMIFTQRTLAARARELLNANETSSLGAWRKVHGLYALAEHHILMAGQAHGIDVSAMLKKIGVVR